MQDFLLVSSLSCWLERIYLLAILWIVIHLHSCLFLDQCARNCFKNHRNLVSNCLLHGSRPWPCRRQHASHPDGHLVRRSILRRILHLEEHDSNKFVYYIGIICILTINSTWRDGRQRTFVGTVLMKRLYNLTSNFDLQRPRWRQVNLCETLRRHMRTQQLGLEELIGDCHRRTRSTCAQQWVVLWLYVAILEWWPRGNCFRERDGRSHPICENSRWANEWE